MPFAVAAAVTVIAAFAVFRLPEAFLATIQTGRPFGAAGSTWIFRGLIVGALLQAAYVGRAVLTAESVAAARERDAYLAAPPEDVTAAVARNAALVPLLTVVYGLSSIAITGERSNFWPFLGLALLQLGWYYRAMGPVAEWLRLEGEAPLDPVSSNMADPGAGRSGASP